jgi:hypothetical protein
MPECPICRREFEDEFSVFVPPHPEGFDSIECAQKAVLIWGAAGGAAAPIVLPTIEFVPPPQAVEPTPTPVVPFARRGLAALAALALIPTSQIALAGGVGLAAAGTAASVYLAAKPVLQAPAPVAVDTTPAAPPAKAPSTSGSTSSSGSATTSSDGTGSVAPQAPHTQRVTRPKPVARRSVVVSTRPARRIHVAAKAHVARSSRRLAVPAPHTTTSTADLASQPVRVTHPHTSTPPKPQKQSSHPKPKPDRAPSKPHAPAKPQQPTSTPATTPPTTTTTPTISSTRVVASVDSAPPKKKKKKSQPQPQPQAQPQADPAPPVSDQNAAPPASDPPCGDDDDSKPGNGNGDKNHDHSGPPGPDKNGPPPPGKHGDDHGKDHGKGKGH